MWDSVLSDARIFLVSIPCMGKKASSFYDCVVGLEVTATMIRPIYICFVIGPQSKLCKEIGAWTCGATFIYRAR